jgi:hypothetical protein
MKMTGGQLILIAFGTPQQIVTSSFGLSNPSGMLRYHAVVRRTMAKSPDLGHPLL